MVIIYDSILTEPPSSVHCFRDVTLYSSVFLKSDNLLVCPKGTRSSYWNWIKRYGAHDFIEEVLTKEEIQDGILVGELGDIRCNLLNELTLNDIINNLNYINRRTE